MTYCASHIQANGCSPEELCLVLLIQDGDDFNQSTSLEESSFGIVGLKLQGASSNSNKLNLTSGAVMTDLPYVRLQWKTRPISQQSAADYVTLPVYLNEDRKKMLFEVEMMITDPLREEQHFFYKRAVAFIA